MNDELSNKIIERINTEKISPLPRWRFILWRVIFWLSAIFSIIIGSLAFGVMFFLFFDYSSHGLVIPHEMKELLLMIPYIWLVIFALFILIGPESIRHTQKGYRYRLCNIVFASVLLSIILGFIVNLIGIGKAAHEFFNQIPAYNSSTYDSKEAWNRPVFGRLAGIVISIDGKDKFSIIDFNGNVWRIRLATSTKGLSLPEASSTIRMSGLIEPSSNVFIVESLDEWE